jgi:hypothetical protein
MSTLRCAIGIAAMLSACVTKARWVPPERSCPGALRPVWIADSSLTVCVVTSFRTHDLRTWTRGGDLVPEDVFTIRTQVSARESALTGGWPPTLGSAPDCKKDCAFADSVIARTDTIAGFSAHTEIGIVGGPKTGLSRGPAFVSGWTMNDSQRAIANGHAARRATLDTMLLMLRSAERWGPSPSGAERRR